MNFDDPEGLPGPPISTAWIEHELRALLAERDIWRGRWAALRDWAATHEPVCPRTVLAHMAFLETQTPPPPPFEVPTIAPSETAETTDDETHHD